MDLLTQARASALAGRMTEAIAIGRKELAHLPPGSTEQLQAHRQLVEWLLVTGRGALAHHHAREMVRMLRPAHGSALRVQALTCHAFAASFVGDSQAALRTATAARDEALRSHGSAMQALALNYFGVAAMWDARWATCHEAFAQSHARLPGNFRPVFNAAFARVLRATVEATLEGAQVAGPSAQAAALQHAVERSLGTRASVAPGVIESDPEPGRLFLLSMSACWEGRLAQAREAEQAVSAQVEAAEALTWMRPYLHFLRAERAIAGGQIATAVDEATAMVRCSDAQDCEQTHWIGRLLRARALSLREEHGAASADWRYLWSRATRRHDEWGDPVAVRAPFDAQPTARAQENWIRRFGLTPAEVDIVTLLLQGNRPHDIARLRGATYGTVRSQLASIYDKSGYRSQAQLVAGLSRSED
jgi:DNA-binding CsgD family transcriptional regulator